MVVRQGEVWHLYKILGCIKKPKTQTYICKISRLHHHKLNIYLMKLKKLGFVVEVENKGEHNIRAKLWKSTIAGEIFNGIIEKYVRIKIK